MPHGLSLAIRKEDLLNAPVSQSRRLLMRRQANQEEPGENQVEMEGEDRVIEETSVRPNAENHLVQRGIALPSDGSNVNRENREAPATGDELFI